MKKLLYAVAMAAGTLASPVSGATDVNVSVTLGQPGYYGRIDVGSAPRPAVIYAQPIIIHQPPTRVVHQPIYLRVPPGHAKHWSKHCGKYDACGRPVYFVQETWYEETYGHRHRDSHGKGHHGKGHHRDG
jgi:hypothetical protein